jgi:hypothetical protein
VGNVNSKNTFEIQMQTLFCCPHLKYKVLILSNSQGQLTGRAGEDQGYDFTSCDYD